MFESRIVLWIALAAMVTLCALPLSAEVIDVPVDRDNTLYEDSTGSLSNGAGDFLFAGRTNQAAGSTRRGLLRFNIALYVPSFANLVGADLNLYLNTASSPDIQSVSLHRVRADWGEGTSKTPGGGGGGDSATANDATWIHTFHDTAFWSSTGGDFTIAPSASAGVDTSVGYKAWSSTGLNADAIDMWSVPDSNFGWIAIGNETQGGGVRKFVTRDHPDSSQHPFLRLFVIGLCPIARTGDLNGDHVITSADIIGMVNWVFKGGLEPLPCEAAVDVNCSAAVTSADIIFLVNHVFKAGPQPCDVCQLIPDTWTCD